MRKAKARKVSKIAPEESGRYEITVTWKNDDKEKGDQIIEIDDNVIEVPDVSGAREYIESLPDKLGLGGGIWKWNGKKTVYRQKGGAGGDHYITCEKVC